MVGTLLLAVVPPVFVPPVRPALPPVDKVGPPSDTIVPPIEEFPPAPVSPPDCLAPPAAAPPAPPALPPPPPTPPWPTPPVPPCPAPPAPPVVEAPPVPPMVEPSLPVSEMPPVPLVPAAPPRPETPPPEPPAPPPVLPPSAVPPLPLAGVPPEALVESRLPLQEPARQTTAVTMHRRHARCPRAGTSRPAAKPSPLWRDVRSNAVAFQTGRRVRTDIILPQWHRPHASVSPRAFRTHILRRLMRSLFPVKAVQSLPGDGERRQPPPLADDF